MNEIMNLKEVAAYLRVHPATVRDLMKKHGLPAFRIGSDYRFRRESIDKWMAAREQNGDKH